MSTEPGSLFEIQPVEINGQGQGATTEFKERCIQHALSVNLRICSQGNKYHARFPYWHFDMHSGSGWNDKANCIGTPLAFLNAIELCGKDRYHAFFCDTRKDAIETLKARPEIANDSNCYPFPFSNREVLPVFAEHIRQHDKPDYAMGSIICDPNGYLNSKPDAVPMDDLQTFCQRYPRIDLIMNLNVRTKSLMHPHIEKGQGNWAGRVCLELDELPEVFSRKHWLIREVVQSRGDRFVLMIGRNFRIGDARSLGFYHLCSKEGKAIVEKTRRKAA